MKFALAALFFATAALYASVGFGGGSTYTALLVLTDTDYRLIPVIALICNILVVSGNTLRYQRESLINWPALWPLCALSVPMSWLGGWLDISETLFLGLLWIALAIAGLRLLGFSKTTIHKRAARVLPLPATLALGGGIGFYAGLVGIGGGIFLAPILYIMHWGKSREIAAACSVFILANSLAGLAGHVTKLSSTQELGGVMPYWPVVPAVLIGGFIGNYLGVFKISELWLKRLTGLLILIVAARLAVKWINLL